MRLREKMFCSWDIGVVWNSHVGGIVGVRVKR